jgi:hypothetical protein
MFTFANKPLNIVSIFLDSISLYKVSLPSVWRWQLFWLLPMVFLPASSLNATGTLNVLTSQLNATSFSWLIILYSILVLLVTIYGETFLLSRIYNIGSQKPVSIKASLLLAKDKFLSILGGYAIIWLIMLALFIVAGLVFGLIYFVISLVSNHSGYTPLLMMTALMIAIGIFLGVLMFFFNLFILFGNAKIIQSIKESIKLVWGNWWRTFGVILVPVIVIFIAIQIMNFLVGLVMPKVGIANNITNLCVLTLLYPWFNSLILVQFNDLKLRRRSVVATRPARRIDTPK